MIQQPDVQSVKNLKKKQKTMEQNRISLEDVLRKKHL